MSFLKAANYQDGHAGYSNPLDEQAFITHYINELQNSPEWDSTAVVIAYDDSDGWYDHKAPEIRNGSNDPHQDKEICTAAAAKVGVAGGKDGQCGPGTRQPLLVISPYAKTNHIDSTYTEQTSVTKFIQDNWGLGRLGGIAFDERAGELNNMFDFNAAHKAPKLFLNETDGTVAKDYASIEKVDNSSRAGTNLKDVLAVDVPGMLVPAALVRAKVRGGALAPLRPDRDDPPTLDVAERVGVGLAVLERQRGRELIGVLVDQVDEPHEDTGAALRVPGGPLLLRGRCGRDRGGDLVLGGPGHGGVQTGGHAGLLVPPGQWGVGHLHAVAGAVRQ